MHGRKNVREEGQTMLAPQALTLSGARQRLVGLMQVVEKLGACRGCEGEVERMPSLAHMGFLGGIEPDSFVRISKNPDRFYHVMKCVRFWIVIENVIEMPVPVRVVYRQQLPRMMPARDKIAGPETGCCRGAVPPNQQIPVLVHLRCFQRLPRPSKRVGNASYGHHVEKGGSQNRQQSIHTPERSGECERGKSAGPDFL